MSSMRFGRREPFLDKTGKVNSKDGRGPRFPRLVQHAVSGVLLGQEKGPRFPASFVPPSTARDTVGMIDGALARIGLVTGRHKLLSSARRAAWFQSRKLCTTGNHPIVQGVPVPLL